MADREFRSPVRKLVALFHASRDKWKQKCQQAKYELKLLKRRYANLKKNHDRWEQQYREAESQRQQLQTEVELLSVYGKYGECKFTRPSYPREEPYAVILHVRICAGGGPQGRFLPRYYFICGK